MPVSITMPQLGESVTEGTVTRWLKDVGDTVEMDEPLLEVSTDKVDTEIPSPVAGVLVEIKAVEDDVVEVGGELAVVGDSADVGQSPSEPTSPAAQPVAENPEPSEPVAPPATPAPEPVASEPTPAPASTAPVPAEPAGPTSASPSSGASNTEVVLPALGESVTEGTVTRWLKAVGDEVAMDEPLLEVSTDKVDTEIPSPIAGTLVEISVAEDETVPVGAVLAIVGTAPAGGESMPETAPAPTQTTSPAVAPKSVPSAEQLSAGATTVPAGSATPYASPIVRKLARESDVDLASVSASGSGGRITKDDVRAAVASAPTASSPAPAASAASPTQRSSPASPATPAPSAPRQAGTDSTVPGERGRTEKMTRLRQVIASRMVDSLHVSAQLTTVVEVDVTRIAGLRTRAKGSFQEREGVSLSYLPFFARATLEALRLYPMVNASVNSEDNTITYHDQSNLGIAVDTDRGLLVPVIRDAGDLTLAGLARRIADLAQRTRTSQVSPDELSGGTFTLTNTGSRGALFDTPIINQPQVGILGTGSVVKRAVVVTEPSGEDVIAIRSMVYLALTYDHRIVDGAIAAQFLTAIKARLESAEFDAELGV